jgi:Outer membrane protein beta-barrel domain
MRRQLFAGLWVVICLVVMSVNTNAQVDEHRSEVGGLLTILSLSDFQSRQFPLDNFRGNSTMAGIGGRYAFNLNKHFAIDAEANFFPENHLLNEEFGQKMQGFIGLKAGIRKKKFGVFAKARPGVMWFGEFTSKGNCSTTPSVTVCGVDHEKDFAMDVGGVVEFYPADRLIVRIDAGDTIIFYPQRVVATFPTLVQVPEETKNNFQLSFGVGWRF